MKERIRAGRPENGGSVSAGVPYSGRSESTERQKESAISARRPDIVGHFDLLARYNGQGRFFDEDSPRYQGIAIEAVREAAKTGAIFEVNSGAMARGIQNRIYPARFLLREIRRLGGRVVLSSDAHRAEHLAFAFPEMEAMLREEGFRTTACLTEHGWEERPLGD